MNSLVPRVRFAPSPTGLLHVGNARTALYNWLVAHKAGGQFILRIEDTDLERSEARFEDQLMDDLHWLGLDWDEGPATPNQVILGEGDRGACGPYRQSQRLGIYAEHTEKLLAEGKAYRCFCTPEELEAEREKAAEENLPQGYSGRCRSLSQEEVDKNLAAGLPFAVRLRIQDHPIRFHDVIRGTVEVEAGTVSDPIIVRSAISISAGVPVYNYANVIDDALMGITCVIRGEGHISNTPTQVATYQAFGWPVPEFAHLSTVLGTDRQKLSKRHGATAVSSFRQMGYLPEALANYLALLGWGAEDGKSEFFTLKELAPLFSLERVTPSPAIFDWEKLNWINRHYIKQADPERIAKLAERQFCLHRPDIFPLWSSSEIYTSETMTLLASLDPPIHLGMPMPLINLRKAWFARLLEVYLPYVDRLDQLPVHAAPIFGVDPEAARRDPENAAILAADSSRSVLSELGGRLRTSASIVDAQEFKMWMNEIKDATGIKGKELYHPVRIALTGHHSGPDFDKLIPLIEEGASLGLSIPTVQGRVEQFTGVACS